MKYYVIALLDNTTWFFMDSSKRKPVILLCRVEQVNQGRKGWLKPGLPWLLDPLVKVTVQPVFDHISYSNRFQILEQDNTQDQPLMQNSNAYKGDNENSLVKGNNNNHIYSNLLLCRRNVFPTKQNSLH